MSRDHYGLKPPQRLRPFEALALSIVSQGQGAHFLRATLSPLAEAFSYKVAYAGHRFCAFPSVDSVVERKVKDLVRSDIDAQQAERLHRIAKAVVRGELEGFGANSCGSWWTAMSHSRAWPSCSH